MTNKEELKKKFMNRFTYEAGDGFRMNTNTGVPPKVFDFFYSEIEARDKEIDALNDDVRGYRNGHELNSKRYIEALSNLQRLEEIIKASEEVIVKASGMISTTKPMAIQSFAVWGELNKALEKYNKLKSKLPSGI